MFLDAGKNRLRLQRHPRAFDAIGLTGLHQQLGNGGVQMEMLVGVDMVQGQSGGGESGELGLDFPRQLRPHLGQKKHCCAGPRHIATKMAAAVHQIGHRCGRQYRLALHQHQMQADPQGRHRAGAPDRVARRRARNHQAGG